jgi:hypothetical protein
MYTKLPRFTLVPLRSSFKFVYICTFAICESGLPDGLFFKPKIPIWVILEGLRMENAGIFYGPLEYCTVIWYILLPLSKAVLIWYIFSRFGILCQEKSGNPGVNVLFTLTFVFSQINED